MAYKLNITWRVTATSHDREEIVVADLAAAGRAIGEGAPDRWDVAYVVVQPTTAQPVSDRPPAQPAVKEPA